jgi:heavy metal translocating P-type ATPase
MKKNVLRNLLTFFLIPFIVLAGIIFFLILNYLFHLSFWAHLLIWSVIAIGSFDLVKETTEALLHKKFALDYIAIVAILTGLITQQYLVAAIIVLMLSGGNTLERYAMTLAKKSLTSLANRIPHEVNIWQNNHIIHQLAIEQVKVDQLIAVRKGEVIPLDGELVSDVAQVDESSLTGEAYTIEKFKGYVLRSGTVNTGELLLMKVTREDKDSTYRKIIEMVKRAQTEKSPLIRLADKYSIFFTLITFILAALGYFLSHDLGRVLAVLVIATPCPLILATPIALMGGMNVAAQKKIIIKRLATIEILSRIQAIIFDKTGTITLGKPKLAQILLKQKKITESDAIAIAAAIERNSLHPFAKAIVEESKLRKTPHLVATHIQEIIGQGIAGKISGKQYILSSIPQTSTAAVLKQGNTVVAEFYFEDQVKKDAIETMLRLQKTGLKLVMYTGDKLERAQQTLKAIGIEMEIHAESSPEDKKAGIEILRKQGFVTAMIGDGINDAPALAFADVGMVFSNEEQTASSEAADIVFLGGDLKAVTDSLTISQQTIKIATESILIGIGLSVTGMILAAFGLIIPVMGAFGQEAIDVGVILNALRASRWTEKS